MAPPPSHQNLTEIEIRILLRQKLQQSNAKRLAYYQKVGRTIRLTSDVEETGLRDYSTSMVVESEPDRKPQRIGKTLPGKLLLLSEVSVVAVLLFTLWYSFYILSSTNQEVAQAHFLPPLTPTPPIDVVYLLSSESSPPHLQYDQSRKAGIPPHFQPLLPVTSVLPPQLPPVEHGIRIRIPAIDVDAPIVEGDGWEQLKKGVGQHIGTANPGQKGNMVLTGHNDVFGEVFRYLDRLKPGDEIYVYSPRHSFTYIITGWSIVEPSQVEVMAPTPSATITLISCYPYLVNSHRIIVKGHLRD